MQDFDLDELVRDSLGMVEQRIAAKGLRFTLDTNGAPRFLRGDAQRLGQALVNYLDNAVKFTAHGGIILRCRQLDATSTDHLLRFEVEDTGEGIAKESQARLFQLSQIGDDSTTRRHGGTGVGLLIAKRLAELMDGREDNRGQTTVLSWLRRRSGMMGSPIRQRPTQ